MTRRLGPGAARRRCPPRSARNPRRAIWPPLDGHHLTTPRGPLARNHRRSHIRGRDPGPPRSQCSSTSNSPAKACDGPEVGKTRRLDQTSSPVTQNIRPERLATRAASFRYGGRHHPGIPGGIIPLYPGGFVGIRIPWRPPSLERVPVSPVPRRQRYYAGATTSHSRIPGRLFVSLPGSTLILLCSCSPWRRSRIGWRSPPGQGIWSAGRPMPARSHVGASGISQVPRRSIPCLCPGPRPRPDRRSLTLAVSSMLPPLNPQRRLQAIIISRLLTRLRHLLPTLHDGRRRRPCKARFRLVG